MITRWWFVLLAAARFTNAVNSCKTPNGIGECKPIPDCPPLHSIFNQKPLTPAKADFLRNHSCGFQGSIPKVCCVVSAELVEPNSLLPDPSSCGHLIDAKIIGGKQTAIDEFPWMALLEYQHANGSRYFHCGGALISKRYVLTAAHCVNKKLISVRLGEHDTASDKDCFASGGEDCAPPPLDVVINEKIVHEKFINNRPYYNDIALLRLRHEVPFSPFVGPICLPSSEEFSRNYTGERLFVAGWGITEKNMASTVKLKVQVPVQESSFCETTYRRFHFDVTLMDTQLCVGGEKGKDACYGDSGGPLMATRVDGRKIRRYYAAAVVSFGVSCGSPGWGAVYTKLGGYVPWIISKLRP